MKGEKYLGKFAPQIKENFDYEEISDLWTSYEGKETNEWIAIHRGHYKESGGFDHIEVHIQNDEIVGVRVVDVTSGKLLFVAGKMIETKRAHF